MSLLDDINTIARGCGIDVIDHVMSPVSSQARSNPGTVSASLQQKGSPAADTGTAGVGVLRLNPAYERFIGQLYELLSNDRFDEAYDLVRAEHRAIHGPQS